ncbi:HAMP domain-containing sensor histidine kinase, partial [Caulobacter sp. 17J65-9]|uniref:PAS domain-containing sensor histidine kinase n=1 Tax=Caulobacter sp. 17J65-9 TaxID=2709382 RepID=UPI0013CC2FA7
AWAVFGSLAAAATGGLTGPLAVWCLTPLAAAVALDGRRMVSGAAALSLFAVALALWVSLTAGGPRPTPIVDLWLSILAFSTTGTALSATVMRAFRRRGVRIDRAEIALGRLEELVAEQPHLMITIDHDGRISSAFGTAPAGVPVDALFSQGLIAAAHHPDRPALHTALLRAASVGEGEVAFTPRAALDREVTLGLRRLKDGRMIGTLRDSTVQQAREAALETARMEAQSLNAGKSRFLANMSHELRTPLNSILGFSDIMRQRMFGPMPDRYAEYAQLIHESGRHLLDLINDVLDMSKIEAERYELHLETFDAREAVSAALRLVRVQAHEAQIALRGVLPPQPLMIEADKRAVKQITLNLLSNALKFTPAGGAVTVSLRGDHGAMELQVADTGVGLSPDDLQRVGRPFEQAGPAGARGMGTGLGLSLVRAFSQLHGGETTIESTLGEGTAVTVRLPVVKLEAGGASTGAKIIPLHAPR